MQRLLGIVMENIRLGYRKGPRFESCYALASLVLHHGRLWVGRLNSGRSIDWIRSCTLLSSSHPCPDRLARRNRPTADEIMYRTNGCMELKFFEKYGCNLPICPVSAEQFLDQGTVRFQARTGPLFGKICKNSIKIGIHWADLIYR